MPPNSVQAHTLDVQATKDAKGNASLHWPTHYTAADGHVRNWDRPWRHHFDPLRGRDDDATPTPWSDNTGKRIVYVDEQAFARALRDVEAARAVRARCDALLDTVRTLTEGVQKHWLDVHVAAERERFMEDYADEDLWAEQEPKVRGKAPRPWNSSAGTDAPWDRLRFLVKRLVESGRAPWGVTVAEALDELGEPLDRHRGTRESDWAGDRWNRIDAEPTLPDELLVLRFPAGPAGTHVATRKDA